MSGPKVTVIDAHGTHIGTPTGTDMHFKASHVVGVWHTSTASGYVFTGWKVTKSSTASNAGTLLSDGGTTSGKVTTFPADYNYAVVFKTGSSGSYSVTIEAVYQQQLTVSYNANGGSPTPAS